MSLDLQILDWLGDASSNDPSTVTLGSLSLRTGPGGQPLLEVEDQVAKTIRHHVNLPAAELAAWLVVHWWRLRWEAPPPDGSPPLDWRLAHQVGAIGGGGAWPPLQISSDGEYVQLILWAEPEADVSSIRYLKSLQVDVPAAAFERAVDRFVEQVDERLRVCLPEYTDLADVKKELDDERSSETSARLYRLEARAGIHSGEASESWHTEVASLSAKAGEVAAEDMLAALPGGARGMELLKQDLRAIEASDQTVDLSQIERDESPDAPAELPWQRGERMARRVRQKLGLNPRDRVSNEFLQDTLGVQLPLAPTGGQRVVTGAYQRDTTTQSPVLARSAFLSSQRFFLGRLVGLKASGLHRLLLPVSDSKTALQKRARAFAQEFLCPWEALDAFTDEYGWGPRGIEGAAEAFEISELAVRSSLVNHGKLHRWRLFGSF